MTVLAWGTIRLFSLRYGHTIEGENEWGFGQILPVLLTALPLWSILNTVYGMLQHFCR